MPSDVLCDVSGCRSGLPPVSTEICGYNCSNVEGSGTPNAAQLAATCGLAIGLSWLQGSTSVASKRENVPYNSPMDGARKPCPQVPRKVRSSFTCQWKPILLLVVPPNVE